MLKRAIALLVLCTIALPGITAGQAGWFRIDDSIDGSRIGDLLVVSRDSVFLFGHAKSSFALFRTHNGGQDWEEILVCDSCVANQDQDYAVGVGLFFSAIVGENRSAIFHIPDGSDEVVALGTVQSSSGLLSFRDSRQGLVAGVSPLQGGVSILVTSNAGSSWEERVYELGKEAGLDWVEFKDSSIGLVRVSSPPEFNYSAVLRTVDGARSWTEIDGDPDAFRHYELNEWIGLRGFVQRSDNDGLQWSEILPSIRADYLAICKASGFITANSGNSMSYSADGDKWLSAEPPPMILKAMMYDSAVGYAIGKDGKIWKTVTGGQGTESVASEESGIDQIQLDRYSVSLNSRISIAKSVSIYDLLGKLVWHSQLNASSLLHYFSSPLPPGLYLLRVGERSYIRCL